MLELSSTRKNKVNLSDYNCQQDIENRSLLADLSFFEHEVLQEIFFSPTKFSLKKLARNLGCEDSALSPILEKLSRSGLLSQKEDTIFVDKEMRKYFEFHMKRFDADFKPDMEYLQGILRKVPIHLLPSWYAIPRTSNNIFESIVDKYLLTPQCFQRYLSDLSFTNPLAHQIIRDVFAAPDYRIASTDLITKYNLTRPEFEEILLMLEFSFVCCVTYTKGDDLWVEWVSPFHEWHEYLKFFKTTEVPSIPEQKPIVRKRKSDYAFVEDLGSLLLLMKKTSLPCPVDPASLEKIASALSLSLEDLEYVSLLIKKLQLIQLIEPGDQKFLVTDIAAHFVNLDLEKRALYLYRHPLNRILNGALPQELATEKYVREAEKSIRRVLKKQWVFFDSFIKGAIVCFGDLNAVALKKIGKIWKYTLPTYTEKEYLFIKTTIFEWLFEVGMVSPGVCEGRDCFTLTPFGRFFFEE
jgi:hypothetical protein